MGLKRKASFTSITSPRSHSSPTYHNHNHNNNQTSPIQMPFLGTATVTVDEPPRHLHSRTRKRFRNDRPDDQSIYDKTLQWLFSAQRKPNVSQNNLESTLAASTADDPPNEQQPSPPPLDPNQQTLQRFFQPVRSSRNAQNQDYNHGFKAVVLPAATPTQHLANNGVSISNPTQPVEGMGMNNTGLDVNMDMDMDGGCGGMEGFVPVHVLMALEQGQGQVHAHHRHHYHQQQQQQQLHEQDRRWVGGIGWM
ncbi:hypothetical protein RJZ56_005778 [Blastomyces dermatitidis]|uniref:Uncharacterized protein n=1 Tax=Ajellomyces dermatitidis (strain ER-3 / ATCC MYA-2586) TaxID=559297 RepID=A0ABP2F6P2_AJEDR|nr:uncharacterized protein BDCG_07387 [Blastomyces dermatitidis ER-3]EEQ92267.1 hypothetical protein BDCG_07387 [Blastomyces dermatitidis ER-3]EQL36324.1 hypothetical protein BDFG_02064 [Blastomyces dermatitidis ATCC 26199]